MSNPQNKVNFTVKYEILFADGHKIRAGKMQKDTPQVNDMLVAIGKRFTSPSIRSWRIPKFFPIFETPPSDFDKKLVEIVESFNNHDKGLVDHEINHENLPVDILLIVVRN